MLRKDKIYNKLKELGKSISTTEKQMAGFSATQLSEHLGIRRNTVSHELNRLVKEGLVVKQSGRPVRFLDTETYQRIHKQNSIPDEYENCKEMSHKSADKNRDMFYNLLPGCTSIITQVEQAKAAIMYPPNGLSTLIIGKTGVGKSYFAHVMYRYAAKMGVIAPCAPFISFNCADYAENPQLLTSQLFGHVRGSFTGAETAKEGLVAKAEGGYLFLDEVHNLPPEGQEMLFTLMDKRVYRRLGETTEEHPCNLRIICATTDSQKDIMLRTFLRRIPIVVELPPLEKRSLSDRYSLIKLFFQEEASRVGKRIFVDKEVVNRLLFTELDGNIGELKGNIQILCSRAFVKSLANHSNSLHIDEPLADFFDSSRYNRDILNIYIGLGAHGVNQPLVATIDKEFLEVPDEYKDTDFYDDLSTKYQRLLDSNISVAEANNRIYKEIDRHFAKILNQSRKGVELKLDMSKIVPQNILDLARHFVNEASENLNFHINDDVLLGIALHTKAFIDRSAEGKTIYNPNLKRIKESNLKEFEIAGRYVRNVCAAYKLRYSEDEAAFMAMFIITAVPNKTRDISRSYQVILLCHGESTASSIAKTANRLLGDELVLAIDMPLDMNSEQIYNQLVGLLNSQRPLKGALLMVDMGSLVDLSQKLWLYFGKKIEIASVSGFNLLMVLDVARKLSFGDTNLKSIVNDTEKFKNTIRTEFLPAEHRSKQRVIWTVCITGIGTAQKIKEMLERSINPLLSTPCNIIALEYTSFMETYNKAEEQAEEPPDVVVGTFDTSELADVPFVSLTDLLQHNGIERIFNIVCDDSSQVSKQIVFKKMARYISLESLMETMVAIDPKKAVDIIQVSLDNLSCNLNRQLDQVKLVQLTVHIAFMIERLVLGKAPLSHENAEEYRLQHSNLYEAVIDSISNLESYFNIKVPKSEIAYLIDILL
ncbi:sigma 54-interacting transcriptional regulator [Tepidanaerobacter acetatoxydans]|uniref:sigma 54-interacting transcriptional regulator n=1 Tax=Tepidanaerobacter acetatoxydans TaxID=499229 RepID=UPI001BD5D731|nr:sigma 54-interacting transcriptional regulator [Tepidanaerobacter acetatoxydans]